VQAADAGDAGGALEVALGVAAGGCEIRRTGLRAGLVAVVAAGAGDGLPLAG
jgi:hypothetical protein